MDDRASHRPATQLHRSISPWGVCETRRVPDNIPFARHTDTLHPPFHPPKRHPSHHPRFTFQPLYGNDSRGFPTVVQACPARHVQNTELTDCRLLGDEKNASAGNPKERESRNRHDMAGDSGVSEARQGGSERPRRGCFRRQEARCAANANRRHVGSDHVLGLLTPNSIPPHTTIPSYARTTSQSTHAASNKSRFTPFLSRKRFSPGMGFRSPRSRGTDPLPCVTWRRNGTQGSVSNPRFGKTEFTLLAVLSIGFRRIVGHGVL